MHMNISMRLGLGFGLVLVLLATVAFIAITRMADLNANIDLLIHDRYPKTVLANDIQQKVNAINIAMLDITIEKDPAREQRLVNDIVEAKGTIKADLEKLEATITSEKGKQLLKRVHDARAAFFQMQEKFLKTMDERKTKEADEIVLTEATSFRKTYFEALHYLNDYQSQLMDDSGKEAAEAYNTSHTVMLTLSALAVLLGIAAAFLITRGILLLLGGAPSDAAALLRKVADGDLTAEVRLRNGVSSSMLYAVGLMVGRLKQVF